jgi:hypothetical protein
VHGAAQAYTPSATSALLPAALEGDHDEDDEDDD